MAALSSRFSSRNLNDNSDDDERSVPDVYSSHKRGNDVYTQSRTGTSKARSMRLNIFSSSGKEKNLAGSGNSTLSANVPREDPLMSYLVNRSNAEKEFTKQQEAARRKQQVDDFDDDRSVVSSGSFFDFFTRAGAADDLFEGGGDEYDNYGNNNNNRAEPASRTNGFAEKMKRNNSVDSIFGLLNFGDDEKGDSGGGLRASGKSKTLKSPPKEEKTSFETAVDQSNSVNGSKIFRRGKRAAERGDWKKAVAYYHIALVKQREFYGEDHVKTAETLNNLGIALMHLGELYGAMTALEEALDIRQKVLGAGAEEVAETTSNIWLVLKASQEQQDG
mmetsp:Transcript_16392/g.34451  ORF Transcript_16392/g.34451 Transcript_16392/m.34451 type:complete len:333 (-) Transcript_16392:371-1369(-)|eukprot:CAMPEP_0171333986 /NCGR_PEP_ID=MMETSP0878-20121228/4359_1 /TAXON_ID=67004 /ORGANISM="Thalassiosira weissflogii, Strain CCMP1336" /LENGTH=332 /DNA_ID=CAMNT_0011835015 /DNA_START=230 /DNA_END=1228 /DNA_ORIENTATION=-